MPHSRYLHAVATLLLLAGCDPKKETPKAPETKTTAAKAPDTKAPPAKDSDAATPPASATFERLDYAGKAPEGLDLGAPALHAVGWRDARGENAMVFAMESREVHKKLVMRHARRAAPGKPWETVRDLKEEKGCKGVAALTLASDEVRVDDLDKDGLGEVTFAYSVGCEQGPQVPLTHKVLMLEDGKKWALRGRTEVLGKKVAVDAAGNAFGETLGGDFKADFGGASPGFQKHAEAVWKATASPKAAPTPANPAAWTASLDGEYLHTHKIVTDLDSGEESSVTDCFSLWTFEDGSIEFGIELNFTLDHMCTIRGVARPRGKNTWVYKGSEEEDKGCVLELTFAKGHVYIMDVSGECRVHWCGARGGLDGYRFALEDKRKDRKKCGK